MPLKRSVKESYANPAVTIENAVDPLRKGAAYGQVSQRKDTLLKKCHRDGLESKRGITQSPGRGSPARKDLTLTMHQ